MPSHLPALAASVRVQLVLAALTWSVPGVLLPVRGLGWTAGRLGPVLVPALAASVVVGLAKALLLERASRRIRDRILGRGPAFVLGFFSPKTWLLVSAMPLSGLALRFAGVPLPYLGCFYVAIGVALLVSGRHLWTAVFVRDGEETARAA
jgi:hypothetical protein